MSIAERTPLTGTSPLLSHVRATASNDDTRYFIDKSGNFHRDSFLTQIWVKLSNHVWGFSKFSVKKALANCKNWHWLRNVSEATDNEKQQCFYVVDGLKSRLNKNNSFQMHVENCTTFKSIERVKNALVQVLSY